MALAEKALKAMDAACFGMIPRQRLEIRTFDKPAYQKRHKISELIVLNSMSIQY